MTIVDPHKGPAPKSLLQRGLDTVLGIIQIFRQSNCPMNAAAIAHFAMLAIIPFLIVAMVVLGSVQVEVGPHTEEIEASQTYEQVAQPIRYFLPFIDDGLAREVRGLVRSHRLDGGVAFVFLVVVCFMFLNALEKAVSNIFRSHRRRQFVRDKRRVAVFFLLALMLIVLSSYFWGFVDSLSGPLWRAVMTVFVLTMAFLVVVYVFGERKLAPFHLAVGAVTFCALWGIAHVMFKIYIDHLAELPDTFGNTLSSIAVLTIWLYYASSVFLFSCCVVRYMRDHWPRKTSA
ncbi:MAG: hypothetical protein CMH54_00760 [Myxococcales bacterium]|nr:hypothetical protein [Myxococcales bacterium]